MADEAKIRLSVRITNGNLDWPSSPTYFTADVAGAKGPTPGAITVSTSGTDVDLSQLTTPGLCWIQNLSETNFVSWGLYEPGQQRFYFLGEILPGEFYLVRLSRYFTDEIATGSAVAADANRLRLVANASTCPVIVAAFEA